jgi:hypothetical protein
MAGIMVFLRPGRDSVDFAVRHSPIGTRDAVTLGTTFWKEREWYQIGEIHGVAMLAKILITILIMAATMTTMIMMTITYTTKKETMVTVLWVVMRVIWRIIGNLQQISQVRAVEMILQNATEQNAGGEQLRP